MGAARWAVVGTALVAAAAAFHLLMSPTGSGGRAPRDGRADSRGGAGNAGTASGVAIEGRDRGDGPPQEELDAASRDAMRELLRGSLEDAEASGGGD